MSLGVRVYRQRVTNLGVSTLQDGFLGHENDVLKYTRVGSRFLYTVFLVVLDLFDTPVDDEVWVHYSLSYVLAGSGRGWKDRVSETDVKTGCLEYL